MAHLGLNTKTKKSTIKITLYKRDTSQNGQTQLDVIWLLIKCYINFQYANKNIKWNLFSASKKLDS